MRLRFVAPANAGGIAIACISFATSMAASRTALADEMGTFGWDPQISAAASSNIASGSSLGVLFTNPALMPDVDDQVYGAIMVAAPRMQARLMPRPAGTDVPRSIYGSTVATNPGSQDRPLPTAELPNKRADTQLTSTVNRISAGFVTGLGTDGLRIGMLVALPAGGENAANIQTHYDDEREAAFSNRLWFTRFGEWNPVTSLITGAGLRFLPWLSAGLSVQLAATATARLGVYVPDGAVQDHVESNMDASVSTSWRPVLGVRAKAPSSPFSLGIVLRGESSFRVDAASAVQLWNDHQTGAPITTPRRTIQQIPIVFGWEPMQLAFGAGYEGTRLSARVAATFARWSHWLDNHASAPQDAAAIAGQSFDTSVYKFHDTLDVAGSVSLRPTRWLEVTVGASYSPTPVPAQVGRTSYVDSDLVALTMGERANVKIFGRKFTIAIATQLWHMLPRTTYKDPTQTVDQVPDGARTLRDGQAMPEAAGLQTNSPGFPGYRAEGWLLASSLSLSHQW